MSDNPYYHKFCLAPINYCNPSPTISNYTKETFDDVANPVKNKLAKTLLGTS